MSNFFSPEYGSQPDGTFVAPISKSVILTNVTDPEGKEKVELKFPSRTAIGKFVSEVQPRLSDLREKAGILGISDKDLVTRVATFLSNGIDRGFDEAVVLLLDPAQVQRMNAGRLKFQDSLVATTVLLAALADGSLAGIKENRYFVTSRLLNGIGIDGEDPFGKPPFDQSTVFNGMRNNPNSTQRALKRSIKILESIDMGAFIGRCY